MKRHFISLLLTLVAMTGQAQTKTATITGYSPALKDGTVAESTVVFRDLQPTMNNTNQLFIYH
jgi:hypothetical protein